MRTGAKIGIGFALFAGLCFALYTGGKKVVEGISYKIKGFGDPIAQGEKIVLPTHVRFDNNSPLEVPVDAIKVDLSYLQHDAYIKGATIHKQNIAVVPGKSIITFMPAIDVSAVINNIWDTITTLNKNQSIDLKADVAVTIAGVTVNETVYHKIKF